ncbi:hypothetical protein ACH4GK_17825 [Streptomyces rimosus]|nr:hypothetical protein [Streptomyces rimosus]
MALPSMPTRDPGRPGERPEDVREYASSTGGWTTNPNEKPVPGTPQETRR